MKRSLSIQLMLATIVICCKCPIYSQTTIILQPDGAEGKDAAIADLDPNNNGESENYIALAWTDGGNPVVMRSLIEFDLTFISPDAHVMSAYLSLYNNPDCLSNNGEHSSLSGPNTCWLQRITQQWEEHTVLWSNQPTTTTIHQVTLPQSTSPHQDYEDIDVTQLVTDMIQNQATSHGFLIRLAQESYYRCMIFASSDHLNPALHPKLVITYTPPIVAGFSVTVEDKTAYFINQSQGATSFLWDFGDSIHSILENPIHTYQQFGDYEVTLIASNPEFADTVTQLIKICVRPVADFTYQVDGYLLTLTNLSQNAISYFWDFGDGDFPFLENPVHFYTSEGEYNLRLIAHNDCEPDTMTMHIVVCQTPVPDFDYTCSHLKVSFLNTSLLNDSCFWNFGDGYGSFHQNPQHIYLEAGEYAVNLTVMHYCESGTLMTNELTQQINVPCSPTAAFIYDIREYEVTFTNNSLNATSSSWDFGDGETSEVTDPVHIYGEIGNYEVKLIAKNDHGSDTIKSLINVTSVPELPNENAVYVYPNPATDKIYLTIDKRHITLVQWQLLNIHGQLIKSDEQFPSNNISELDVSKLSKGIYLLRIISQGYISTQKLIIY